MNEIFHLKIALIGAGNVATHFAKALHQGGFNIVQVYSRTANSAQTLAQAVGADYTCILTDVTPLADLYIVSVKDSAMAELLPTIAAAHRQALFVHTAGSMPMDLWQDHAERYGVVYPMQTFSKTKSMDFRDVPIFIEANSSADENLLTTLFKCVSDKVAHASTEQRKYLHLAAVFACNFSNHMYAICEKILNEHQLPFSCMLPLIDETAQKAHAMSPVDGQTGPAQRNDTNVIHKQLQLLNDDETLKEIYNLISQNIYKYSQNPKQEPHD